MLFFLDENFPLSAVSYAYSLYPQSLFHPLPLNHLKNNYYLLISSGFSGNDSLALLKV